jgi:hypothetical protein
MSTPESRRRLKAYQAELDRVVALERKLLRKLKVSAERRAAFYVDHGSWPPAPELPAYPEFPSECRDMICGGKSRRTGLPCKSKSLYANGRCKWHGGLSTGPRTRKGKARSLKNLKQGPKL